MIKFGLVSWQHAPTTTTIATSTTAKWMIKLGLEIWRHASTTTITITTK